MTSSALSAIPKPPIHERCSRPRSRPPATRIEVTNSPGAPGSPGTRTVTSGYGLVGLRERVTTLGGHLSTGPAGAGSWRLAAHIPHPVDIEQNGTTA
ncbi:hypothetical protein [Microbispora sp. NPDC046933]|uniref:hypothetical protein n=1 Tax=Microbispora sp. NPDC046933 TaxID=3155618 RepID=UPI0033EFA582